MVFRTWWEAPRIQFSGHLGTFPELLKSGIIPTYLCAAPGLTPRYERCLRTSKDTCDWQARHGSCPPSGGVFLQGTVWGPASIWFNSENIDSSPRVFSIPWMLWQERWKRWVEWVEVSPLQKDWSMRDQVTIFHDWAKSTQCWHYHVSSVAACKTVSPFMDQQVRATRWGSLPKVTQLVAGLDFKTTFCLVPKPFSLLAHIPPNAWGLVRDNHRWCEYSLVPGRGRKEDDLQGEAGVLICIASCRPEHKEEGVPTFPLLQDSLTKIQTWSPTCEVNKCDLQNPAEMCSLILLILNRLT